MVSASYTHTPFQLWCLWIHAWTGWIRRILVWQNTNSLSPDLQKSWAAGGRFFRSLDWTLLCSQGPQVPPTGVAANHLSPMGVCCSLNSLPNELWSQASCSSNAEVGPCWFFCHLIYVGMVGTETTLWWWCRAVLWHSIFTVAKKLSDVELSEMSMSFEEFPHWDIQPVSCFLSFPPCAFQACLISPKVA